MKMCKSCNKDQIHFEEPGGRAKSVKTSVNVNQLEMANDYRPPTQLPIKYRIDWCKSNKLNQQIKLFGCLPNRLQVESHLTDFGKEGQELGC